MCIWYYPYSERKAELCAWYLQDCRDKCKNFGKLSSTSIEKALKSEVKVSDGKDGTCQKSCAFDFGKCLIETEDFKSCFKAQNSCGLDCIKKVSSNNKSVKQLTPK